MSFYGNISNAGKTQMSFDRVYPNRKIMEENAPTDGVFVGRFVLVEYDDNTYSHRTGFINFLPTKDEELNGKYSVYTNAEFTIPFKLTESNDDGYGLTQGDLVVAEYNNYYYYFQCNGKTDSINGNAYFNYIMSSSEFFEKGVTDYTINYNEDKEYAKKQKYPFTTGWNSTVWRKAFKNGKEQYQMIASLSSVTPKFTFVPEAPTLDPIMPHFGTNSTNINYDLHFQPNWGLKIREIKENEKSDFDVIPPEGYKEYNPETGLDEEIQPYHGAIYFNKDGFNPEVISHVDQEDEVSILPTGISGQTYITHTNNGDIIYEERPDTQEITLNLPSIGNTISEIWDIVYGPNQSNPEKLRDMNLSWDDNTSGNRLVTEDPDGNGYQYNPERIQTIAGSINSVHDLMGRIIVNSPPPDGDIELANANKIYYGEYNSDISDNKGFYFKDKTYELQSFEEAGIDPDEYVGKRKYYNLTQFSPNTYYTYSNRNFYLDKSTVPAQDTLYYKLGEPVKVPLKQWQPEITVTDPDTGKEIITKQYSYYKNESLDYIKDKSEQPDQNKTYYQITTTKVTNPKHKDENDNSEIIKFFWPAGLDSNSNKFLGLASSIISNTEDLEILGGNDDAENLEDKSIIQQGYFYRQVNENGNDLLIPCTDLTENDYNPDTEYFYFDKYALSAESQDDKGIRSRVAYIITTKLEGTITTNRLGPNFTEALNNETYYEKYLKPNLVKMIPFEDNKYYYEIKDETIEGYKCIHNLEDNIFNETVCYTIEATYDAGVVNSQSGPDTPPNEEGKENNTEEIFFYKPNLYFIKDRNNYLLSKSNSMTLGTEYYLLTDKNNALLELDPNRQDGTLLITPETDKFYEPSKYYYKSSEFLTDILDNGIIMKTIDEPNGAIVDPETGLIYYTLQEAYVVEDTAGILEAGSVWDKEVAPPDTVTLGIRTETYKWTELKGFAEQLNTIHGLILEINKFLKFNDTLTRDRTTVQGCINQINDIINVFGEINPSDTVIINSYGQFAGARYITDNWISVSTNKSLSDPSITINHASPTDNTTQIGETTAKTLKFGDSFKSYNFGIDEKGHINNAKTNSVDITMPSLSISNGTTGNVLTSLKVSADGQSIVANSSDIGTLTLTSYAIQGDSKVAVNDSINNAFGKLQGQIDALDFTDSSANTTQFISKITQTDGKINVERHNAGDLVLTGYSVATAKAAITTTDTINSAFGKVEYRLNILQADSTQEGSVAYQIAQIVNENNNGSIDTLNEIAAWIVNDETGVGKINEDISNLKTDVSKLKESVGEKTVSAQINEALFINDKAIYALASDLSNSNQRIEALESHVDTWNAAEANVQSDWNESDTTSDAYILNKPDLTNMVETTSQFDYTVGDTTNQLTIAQLVAKVAELETTIQTLTTST